MLAAPEVVKAPLHKYVEKKPVFVAFLPKNGYIYGGLWEKVCIAICRLGNQALFYLKTVHPQNFNYKFPFKNKTKSLGSVFKNSAFLADNINCRNIKK